MFYFDIILYVILQIIFIYYVSRLIYNDFKTISSIIITVLALSILFYCLYNLHPLIYALLTFANIYLFNTVKIQPKKIRDVEKYGIFKTE